MPSMEDYEEIGETVGRLILKTKNPKLTFFSLVLTPVIMFHLNKNFIRLIYNERKKLVRVKRLFFSRNTNFYTRLE